MSDPCRACRGTGDVTCVCSRCQGTGEDTQILIAPLAARQHDVELERDGWREIANALIVCAFGGDIGNPGDRQHAREAWSDRPPMELLDAIRGDLHGGIDAEAIRAAMIGRAWRVRGRSMACDYPLCPDRAALRSDSWRSQTIVPLSDLPMSPNLRVCSPGIGLSIECLRWAQWVVARAVAGRISVR